MSDEIHPPQDDDRERIAGIQTSSAGEQASLDIVEVSGRIKWFDVAKGFGFIVADDGGPDVLLHVTCLRRDGYQAAHEGARIVVEALHRPRGLQATRVVSLDDSSALHPSELPLPRTHVTVVPSSALEPAVVKETLRRYGIAELKPGDKVLVRYGDGSKGVMAAEVRLVDSALPPSH